MSAIVLYPAGMRTPILPPHRQKPLHQKDYFDHIHQGSFSGQDGRTYRHIMFQREFYGRAASSKLIKRPSSRASSPEDRAVKNREPLCPAIMPGIGRHFCAISNAPGSLVI